MKYYLKHGTKDYMHNWMNIMRNYMDMDGMQDNGRGRADATRS